MASETKNKQLINAIVNSTNLVNGGDSSRAIPFNEGDTFVFQLPKQTEAAKFIQKSSFTAADGKVREYSYISTVDGDQIAVSHLVRRRNGLSLSGVTVKDRLASFCKLFTETNGVSTLHLTIDKIVTRKFDNADGSTSRSNYLIFTAS